MVSAPRSTTRQSGQRPFASIALLLCLVSFGVMVVSGGRQGPLALHFESCLALAVVSAGLALVQPLVPAPTAVHWLGAIGYGVTALYLSYAGSLLAPERDGLPAALRLIVRVMPLFQLIAIVFLGAAALLVAFGSPNRVTVVPTPSRLYVAGGLTLVLLGLLQASLHFYSDASGISGAIRNAAYYPSVLTLGCLAIVLGAIHAANQVAKVRTFASGAYLVGACLTSHSFWVERSNLASLGVVLMVPGLLLGLLPLLRANGDARREPN